MMEVPNNSGRILDPYRPSEARAEDEEDDSEVPQVVAAHEVREAMATISPYVRQQWDPGMLSCSP